MNKFTFLLSMLIAGSATTSTHAVNFQKIIQLQQEMMNEFWDGGVDTPHLKELPAQEALTIKEEADHLSIQGTIADVTSYDVSLKSDYVTIHLPEQGKEITISLTDKYRDKSLISIQSTITQKEEKKDINDNGEQIFVSYANSASLKQTTVNGALNFAATEITYDKETGILTIKIPKEAGKKFTVAVSKKECESIVC